MLVRYNCSWVFVCAIFNLALAAQNTSVLVFGDSFGDTGPTWHALQDMFDRHGVEATVRSAAIGGTAACQWASKDNGHAMVEAARKLFPELPDGPDFVWYTLGANDLVYNKSYHACTDAAKTKDDALACVRDVNKMIVACSEYMFDNYFKAFPKSKIMQSGYDIPCEDLACLWTLDSDYAGQFCKHDRTCINSQALYFQENYIGALTAKYPSPQYTGLNLVGTVQKAAGIPGADVGKPVLGQGAKCEWTVDCVHPKYGTPAGTAFAEAMWTEYFKDHVVPAREDPGSILV